MIPNLQLIIDTISKNEHLSEAEKASIVKAAKEVDKLATVLEFKLNRSEKERRTINVLLDETIGELQQKSLVLEQANLNLVKTLEELKDTQAQLIQSEKMASLGELTAGIAHEIKNPLNFVNNYSELSAELVEEMKEQLRAGNEEEAIALADNIEQNLEKIYRHGKRADVIVNGMLEHSRMSTGKKEPTDINLLVEEHLHLSYHGLRTKDESITTTLQTQFDENVDKINIVPEDIGRVMINLFNNAFYSVTQKKKILGEDYMPTISVTTEKQGDKVLIAIRDNGTGIPPKVAGKIFQPFFTTKPPGEGTGLGLSLSYDIITKGHGGELKVTTKEGEYAEFVIQLPLN